MFLFLLPLVGADGKCDTTRGKPTPEDVLDMFKWFFPTLTKIPNLMLIVYLPKIFSSVAGRFCLDSLNLLSAGTVCQAYNFNKSWQLTS